MRSAKAALFVALLATALVLGPALAHLFELPNKIDLPREAYFTVQQIYRGWNQFAWLLLIQLAAIVATIILARGEPRTSALAIVALLCLLGAQGLFWTYTYPANAATNNWTRPPDNWEVLRTEWEYSHAAGALLQLVGLTSLIAAAVASGGRR